MSDEIASISIARSLKPICVALKSIEDAKREKKRENSDTVVVDAYEDDEEENARFKKLSSEVDETMWGVLEPFNSEFVTNEMFNRKMISCCRALVAGGELFEDFGRRVREFDDAPTCGLVWTPQFVAYRCRTCGLTPCMSMCAECFLAGNHDGHDYNMFRSQAGGACDCGDHSVMKESGFCPKHSASKQAKKTPPEDLLCVTRYILPHIYRRLFFHFREHPGPARFKETDSLVGFLQQLSDMGAAMKHVLSTTMLDAEAYRRLFDVSSSPMGQAPFLSKSNRLYQDALKSMESIATQDDADALDSPELCAPLSHETFVDEFMFWLVMYEFPQKLVTLLLSLLANDEYKTRFSEAFVQHYTRTSALLSKQRATETVANRVIHMSVQLMSSEKLSLKLNKDHKLLRILVVSLHNMIKKGLVECTLHSSVRNFHRVADCSSPIMENHNYWALASDLHNVLGHKALARAFLRDPALVDLWCNFIAFFQGMNVNTRQLEQHLEYESRAYYPAFTVEIEICSAVLWCLVHHLKDDSAYDCILYTVQYVLGQIQEWFENIHFVPDSCWKPPPLSVTFHLPLHRLYAAFVWHGIKMGMQVMFPSETFLRQLVMHPLQIQVVRSEIAAGMWVRNGQSMRYQSCLYVQSHFCSSFLDLDLYLLQSCGSRVHPDWFVLTTFERFHLVEWLSFAPSYASKRFLRPEWETPMLEGALRLLATIVCNTTHLGMSEEDATRAEVATLLAMGNKTHSQILEQLPDAGLPGQPTKFVEKVLAELATYQPPQFEPGGTMKQGIYVPKDVVWLQHFDPLFVMLRSMQVKEYQDAFIRYTDFIRRTGMYKSKSQPWPPLMIPKNASPAYDTLRRLLHCRSLHAILYVILYKVISESSPASEHVLYLVVYLLELAVQLPAPGAAVTEAASKRHTVLDLQFCGWFPGNCVFTNLCHRVDRVLHIDNMPGLSRSCQDGSDTDADFPDLIRLRAKLSGSTLATTPDNQLVPHSRSGDIPFIDSIETDLEVDTDYFYNKAMSYLPTALRRQYLTTSPERLALTMDEESAAASGGATSSNEAVIEETPEGEHEEDSEDRHHHDVAMSTGSSDHEEAMHEDSEAAAATSNSVLQQYQQQQLAIECQPNQERSLVLKVPGILVRSVLGAAQGGRGDGSAQQQGMYLSDADRAHPGRLPPSAPPPRALPQPKVHVTNTNESILSLLIKVHDKLAASGGNGQQYRPPTTSTAAGSEGEQSTTALVGDGPFYIRNLLDKIYELSASCRCEIDSLCGDASTASDAGNRRGDKGTTEEESNARKKAAKERQQRLMAQFTSRQKAVMDQLLQQEAEAGGDFSGSSMANKDEEEMMEPEEDMECVICNQTSTISLDRPIALVASAVSTSVFGKTYPEGRKFVTSIFSVPLVHKLMSRGKQESDYYRLLFSSFNKLSCISSTSMGWEGGICVSTCGHHVHFDCHEAYMKALKADPNRAAVGSILAVDKGEFHCPVCRQLGNCVLPLVRADLYNKMALKPWQRRPSITRGLSIDYEQLVADVMNDLEPVVNTNWKRTEMSKACENFIQRLMESTYPRFSEFVSEMNAVWAYLCGVIRTNLESQLIWNTTPGMQKRSCLGALLKLIPAQILDSNETEHACLEWASLTGAKFERGDGDADADEEEEDEESDEDIEDGAGESRDRGARRKLGRRRRAMPLANVETEVPMILRDTSAVLVRMALLMFQKTPSSDHFAAVCHAAYNLIVFQSIVNVLESIQLGIRAPESVSNSIERDPEAVIAAGTLESLAGYIFRTCYAEDYTDDKVGDEMTEEEEFYCAVQNNCLPFLKTACMLKQFGAWGRSSTNDFDVVITEMDFEALRDYALGPFGGGGSRAMKWHGERGVKVLNGWMEELKRLTSGTEKWTPVLARPHAWAPPRLLPLPKQFDLLFQRFHKAQCAKCRTTPKETLLCLVCGDVVCFRDTCCMSNSLTEAETHAVDCGAGTGVYLSVQTSTIMVTRDKKAANWGSLYLDAHGEEDRGLKRGKPLFLSEERFAALEQNWRSHAFDSVCKRWFWIGQSWLNTVIPL